MFCERAYVPMNVRALGMVSAILECCVPRTPGAQLWLLDTPWDRDWSWALLCGLCLAQCLAQCAQHTFAEHMCPSEGPVAQWPACLIGNPSLTALFTSSCLSFIAWKLEI